MNLIEAAQMALDYLDAPSSKVWAAGTQYKIIQALRAALAQPEQEIESDRPHVEDDGCPTEKAVLQRFWREHQKQEPVAQVDYNERGNISWLFGPQLPDKTFLYTAPPQREWQGLTDEEVRDLWSWSMTAEAERTANTQQHAFARAIEAKLKEKNS